MNIIRNISRLLIGIMFIFSGFVKAIDPLGSTYKFTDYFTAFGLEWLSPAGLFFAVMLAAIEFAIGFALLNNIFMRISSQLMFIFMSFFTILTFYLALTNPVSDCGCFGDAIKLTNWQTFYKNLIIMIPAGIVFWQGKKFHSRFNKTTQLIVGLLGILISLYISKNAYNHLPPIDFRPYSTGTNISLAMNEDWKGAPQPVFETKIVYKKNDKQKTFSADNLPDSTWTWVETKSKLVEKGYEPPIHNFNLTNKQKNDITDKVLNHKGLTLMLIAYDLEKIPEASISKIRRIMDVGNANNYQTFIVTASTPEQYEKFQYEHSFMAQGYFADPITLKTVVRSNPGLVLMHEGLILNKWHYNDFPLADDLNEYKLYQSSLNFKNKRIMYTTGGFIVLWLLIAALFEIAGLKTRNRG